MGHHGYMADSGAALLAATAAEIEEYVGRGGWDRPATLFALVHAGQFAADDPQAAARLGLADSNALTPVEQEPLPDGPLDETLARIAWPDGVTGCALSQEILLLPPSAEADIDSGQPAEAAAAHPDRREARIVAAVLRDGSSAVVLRLRAADATGDDDLLTGDDLAPNLVRALLDTFA